MYSNESALRSTRGNVLVSWQFIVLQVLLLLGVAVYLEKPKGSLAGTIALQQQKFGLYSYDLTKNKAYVIAIGPRGTTSDERGVWVRPDGTSRSINCRSANINSKCVRLDSATSMSTI